MKRYSRIRFSRNNSRKDIYYTSWTDYVLDIQEGKVGNKPKNIFRGQSNFEKSRSTIWNIQSSFNRIYDNTNFLKNKYAEYGNIKNYLTLYKTASTNFISDTITFIDILQFFQHYSIPTPLIDFTSDPLIALYFSLSPIPSLSKGTFGDKKKRYLTVTEIDLDVLKYFLNSDGVEELLNQEIDTTSVNYENTLKKLKSEYTKLYKDKEFVIDFFLEPNIKINPNLFRQKGAFLYLDSLISFEEILDVTVKKKKFNLTEPLLIRYNIPYDTCFVPPENKTPNIFAYLLFKQKTGIFLFENDIQGLKNDLFNGNFTCPMDCLGKINDCECRKILIDNRIIL